MKLMNVVAGSLLAAGLGLGAVAGMGVASAAPGAPGSDIAQKPHHGDEQDWDDWGPGRGRGDWGRVGWGNGIDACVSATGPFGNVSAFACI